MSYKIAIASGKGGTGKTTVAVNLSYFFNQLLNKQVQLVDCDVEEPNDLLFFSEAKKTNEEIVYQQIPKINTKKCTFCKKCESYCEFNAISIIPSVKYAEISPTLCHSCGACSIACQFDAITEYEYEIGKITCYSVLNGRKLSEGRLKVGSPMQTLMIKRTKESINISSDIILFDSPPGTSCPVVESVADVDFVILVTEPTPFGLHDMKLMVELLHDIKKPFGIIINKSGLGNAETYNYIKYENFELLGEIPFMKSYASNYAKGKLFENIPNEIQETYVKIAQKISSKINSDA